MIRLLSHCWFAALLSISVSATGQGPTFDPQQESNPGDSPKLVLRDGDHVVWLGATFVERAQQFGDLETVLTTAAGTGRVTFRNLGWSGDTVFAESRGVFDPPEVGYRRMIEHVLSEQPTVILICYGQNEALSETISEQDFADQLHRLIQDLQPTQARIVLVTPHELLPTRPPIPSPSRFNDRIGRFIEVLRAVSEERDTAFVDLFSDFTADLWAIDRLVLTASAGLPQDPGDHPELLIRAAERWSDNGMHFNAAGYRTAALVVADRLLGASPPEAELRVDVAGGQAEMTGGDIRAVRVSESEPRTLTIEFREHRLTPIPVMLQVTDQRLAERLSGIVQTGDSAVPLAPVAQHGADSSPRFSTGCNPQYDRLRELVVRKNELYFHRWRPQNVTYLFGFRKHEQGNNAVEIPQFDPLVEAVEDQIHDLKQPRWRTLTLQTAPGD